MVYIFDLENIAGKAFNGIGNLTEKDTVVIFYSQNSKNISMDVHLKIVQSVVKKVYTKVKIGGKNALDFQLASYIGFLYGNDTDEQITIISGDTGFDYVVDFWKERGCNIARKTYIAPSQTDGELEDIDDLAEVQITENRPVEVQKQLKKPIVTVLSPPNVEKQELINVEKPVTKKSVVSKTSESVSPVKADEPKGVLETLKDKKVKDAEEIVKLIDKYKTKQGINNALCKKLGSQTAGEVYKIMKPFLVDKKGR